MSRPAANVGELTFQITSLLQDYLVEHGLRYQQIAEILGALEGARLDFIDQVVVGYEHGKAEANGNVWFPLRRAGVV